MSVNRIVVALALLLSATSVTLAQQGQYQRPGPYYGNDYGPDNAQAQQDIQKR
jgi:hypothetical protein